VTSLGRSIRKACILVGLARASYDWRPVVRDDTELRRPVMCVSGDGSAMWSIQSLWTASRYDIPVTFVIISNGCYRQVRLMKTLILGEENKGRFLGTDLCGPQNDFCKIAEGMGISGQKITQPSQIKEALDYAINSHKPNVVEVIVDPAF
jgi:benzoylformate decarboxylase